MTGTSRGPRSPTPVRCAIYTRKSTEEGLEQEFNTLDAQRESAEAFIKSQAHEGWVCLPEPYDDGGYTGGNMERPALQKLLADIAARKIDCVVVYKVDRLSRSLLDFARMMEIFEKHRVSFVSVTQQFNTASSMGRLILNVLLSFAQFEREMISERTRDKMAAARRKGRWSGGRPVLGYDVAPHGGRLVINEAEASRVRQIFDLYIEKGSLIPTVRELERRDWRNKQWTTKKGTTTGGRLFDKSTLYHLLTNVVYVGRITYKREVHPGLHPPIVDAKVFNRVQKVLQTNGRTGGVEIRSKFGSILNGILQCGACQCAMSHSHTKQANKRYRYYVCVQAQKRGWSVCPSKSVSAPEIERWVVDQIRGIGGNPAIVAETLAQARRQAESRIAELESEQDAVSRDLVRDHGEVRRLIGEPADERTTARLADLNERIRRNENRVQEISADLLNLHNALVDERDVRDVLGKFDAVWQALSLREQARVIRLLVERVVYNGATGEIEMTLLPPGINRLGETTTYERENVA